MFRMLIIALCLPGVMAGQTIGGIDPPNAGDPVCDVPVYIDPDGTNNTSGLLIGETAIDFMLHDSEGNLFHLDEALTTGHVLLVSGSYTCPRFRQNLHFLEDIVAAFGDTLTAWIVYCVEAHPHTDVSPYFGYVNPATSNIEQGILYDQPVVYGDRINAVDAMLAALDVPAPVLLDTPCNEWWDAYGPAENNAYLIAPSGEVVLKHGWMNGFGLDLEADIAAYFGVEAEEGTPANGTFVAEDEYTEAVVYTDLLHAADLEISNPSEASVEIQVSREVVSATPGWEFSMCYGLCYSPEIDTISFELFPGYAVDFTLYVYPNGLPGSAEVALTFTNLNDPSNTHTWTVTAASDYSSVPASMERSWVLQGRRLIFPEATGKVNIAVYSAEGRRVWESRETGTEVLIPERFRGIHVLEVVDQSGLHRVSAYLP